MLVKDMGGRQVFIKTEWTARQNLEAKAKAEAALPNPDNPTKCL